MRFSQKKLIESHNTHLKTVYGDDIFTNKDKPINYGWAEDDYSICSKIYKKGGHECLSTFYKLGLYGFACSKL
jgi:hypothetical protein